MKLFCLPFAHDYKTDKVMDNIQYQICTSCLKIRLVPVATKESGHDS